MQIEHQTIWYLYLNADLLIEISVFEFWCQIDTFERKIGIFERKIGIEHKINVPVCVHFVFTLCYFVLLCVTLRYFVLLCVTLCYFAQNSLGRKNGRFGTPRLSKVDFAQNLNDRKNPENFTLCICTMLHLFRKFTWFTFF